jgi:hypothetical protein
MVEKITKEIDRIWDFYYDSTWKCWTVVFDGWVHAHFKTQKEADDYITYRHGLIKETRGYCEGCRKGISLGSFHWREYPEDSGIYWCRDCSKLIDKVLAILNVTLRKK